jgi:hypothetical protein
MFELDAVWLLLASFNIFGAGEMPYFSIKKSPGPQLVWLGQSHQGISKGRPILDTQKWSRASVCVCVLLARRPIFIF